jgi:hypothetical protein
LKGFNEDQGLGGSSLANVAANAHTVLIVARSFYVVFLSPAKHLHPHNAHEQTRTDNHAPIYMGHRHTHGLTVADYHLCGITLKRPSMVTFPHGFVSDLA